jgi:hypothetical protein
MTPLPRRQIYVARLQIRAPTCPKPRSNRENANDNIDAGLLGLLIGRTRDGDQSQGKQQERQGRSERHGWSPVRSECSQQTSENAAVKFRRLVGGHSNVDGAVEKAK